MKPLLSVKRLDNGDDFTAIIPWLMTEDSTMSRINEDRLQRSWSTMNSLLISWLTEEQAMKFILTFGSQYEITQLL